MATDLLADQGKTRSRRACFGAEPKRWRGLRPSQHLRQVFARCGISTAIADSLESPGQLLLICIRHPMMYASRRVAAGPMLARQLKAPSGRGQRDVRVCWSFRYSQFHRLRLWIKPMWSGLQGKRSSENRLPDSWLHLDFPGGTSGDSQITTPVWMPGCSAYRLRR